MQGRFSRYNYSTIDADAVRKLPIWKPAPTYHLQGDYGNSCYGNGCCGDPPGYPTYFTQSVFTQHGNSPRRGAMEVIKFEGVHYVTRWKGNYDEEKTDTNMHRLYKPLPEAHPRVQAWIASSYARMAHCYWDPGPFTVGQVTKTIWEKDSYSNRSGHQREQQLDPGGQTFTDFDATVKFVKSFDEYAHADIIGTEKADYRHPATLVYPVPYYILKSFTDDPRFSDEWRRKEKASVEQANAEIQERYACVCTPENSMAFLKIREFYPEHRIPVREVAGADGGVKSCSYVEIPPTDCPGDWWEREAVQPMPGDCPGSYDKPHRTDGWCQYCGHIGVKEATA